MDTNKIIEDILKNLISINNSLEIMTNEKGGVVINDTLADVSVWVDLGMTIMATVLGGVITIILFSIQEKLKTRQNLRLKFYEEYEPKYGELLKKLILFKDDMKSVSNHIAFVGTNIKIHAYERIETLADVSENFQSDRISQVRLSMDELVRSFEELREFFNSRKKITGYSEFKFEKDLEDIKKIQKKFGELKDSYDMTKIYSLMEFKRVSEPHEDEHTKETDVLTEEKKKSQRIYRKI